MIQTSDHRKDSSKPKIELSKIFDIPKPINQSLNSSTKENEQVKSSVTEKESVDVEPKLLNDNKSFNHRNRAETLDSIIKSLKKLDSFEENKDSRISMNINIFYQPNFTFNEMPSNSQSLPLNTPNTTTNTFYKKSPQILSPKVTLFDDKPNTNDVIKQPQSPIEVQPILNNTNVNLIQDEKPKPLLFSPNNKTLTLSKASNDPVKYNLSKQSKTIPLRKRQSIEESCKCTKKRTMEVSIENDPLFEQQLIKMKYYWRGTNPSYPFVFKRRVMKYYVDTDEISVDDVLDYSRRVILTDDMFL